MEGSCDLQVIVYAYDPGTGIYSLKAFQLQTTPEAQIGAAIREAADKYAPNLHTIAGVPSRPGSLDIGEVLTGDLFLEFPVQRATWTGAARDRLCSQAAQIAVQIVDANGANLCA